MAMERLYSGSASAVAALHPIRGGKLVQYNGYIDMIRPDVFFPDGQHALIKRFGLGVATSHVMQNGPSFERDSRIRVVGAQRLFHDGKGTLEERLGLRVAPLQAVEVSQLAHRLADRGMVSFPEALFLDRRGARFR